MKRYICSIAIVVLALFATLSGCDTIHEFPTPGEEINPTVINTTIHITTATSSKTNSSSYDVIDSEEYPKTISSDQSILVVLEAYEDGNETTPVQRVEELFAQESIDEGFYMTMQLDPLKYRFVAWVSYVDTNDSSNAKHFDTSSNLRNISLVTDNDGQIVANTDHKSVYTCYKDVDLTISTGAWEEDIDISMVADYPVSKYYLIASDVDKYIENYVETKGDITRSDLEDYNVSVYYEGFTPSSINAYTGELNDALTGLYYKSSVEVISDDEAVIAMDYPLTKSLEQSDYGTTVTITVVISDKDGNYINEYGGIEITTSRGVLSIVKAEFFTREVQSGVNVDQSFDGEYNIFLDDDGNIVE